MAGEPILVGLTGAVFLLTVETGGRIQSFERTTGSKTMPVYNAAVGMTDGQVFHDFIATYTVEIITIRTTGALTGMGLAAPGGAYVLENVSTGNGVSAGGVYVLTTRLSHQGENLERMTVTAEQRPGIS